LKFKQLQIIKISIYKKTAAIISVVFLLLLSSCHSKDFKISREFSKVYAWNRDSTAFAFTAINKIYRSPEGIAKFPDGGKIKIEYYDVALYYYDIKNKTLNRIVDFNDILPLYWKDRYYWSTKILFNDSLIYYKIDTPDKDEIRWARDRTNDDKESMKLDQIINKVSKIHTYNIRMHTINSLDFLPSNVEWAKFNSDKAKKLRKRCLEKIPCADWGINIQKQFQQSKDIYIDYIVEGMGSDISRKCIWEQIAPSFNKDDVKNIIVKMEDYKTKLYEEFKNNDDGPYQKSLKKSRYENYTRYFDKIKNRLKNVQ